MPGSITRHEATRAGEHQEQEAGRPATEGEGPCEERADEAHGPPGEAREAVPRAAEGEQQAQGILQLLARGCALFGGARLTVGS